ncbi:MAG: O-antigen ligase family protein [Prevotellaceae bacterium]|jgi:hypothetical protein|nr:O-antigen ligase family protein [Prevotellaceae bacterium]
MISKHNTFFILLALFLVFGVVLYDNITFTTYTDEFLVFALCLLAFACVKRENVLHPPKPLVHIYILLGVFVFYLCYSLFIKSNVPAAILQDFVVQLKPFLAFFATMLIAPQLKMQHKKIIRLLCILCMAYLALIGVYSALSGNLEETMGHFIGHPSRFATAVTATAMLFLYASENNRKNFILFFIFMTIGLLSLRSKFYGFFVLCITLLLLYRKFELRLSVKSFLLIIPITAAVFYFSYDKINAHFIAGANAESMYARPALFIGAFQILKEHFFFGSGFASYATFFSAPPYYSQLYYELGFDRIWGLMPDFPAFIADTFYPALAQFGMVGIVLFVYFFYKVTNTANNLKGDKPFIKEYTFIILIVMFFIVESVADSTFTHNRGAFMMMLMAMCLTNLKRMNDEILEE